MFVTWPASFINKQKGGKKEEIIMTNFNREIKAIFGKDMLKLIPTYLLFYPKKQNCNKDLLIVKLSI